MRKLTALLLTLTLVFGMVGFTGCHKNIPQPEPPIVQYERGLLVGADVANTVAAALKTVDAARLSMLKAGQIDAEMSAKILAYEKAVAVKNQAAIKAIKLAEVGGESAQVNWKQAFGDVVVALKDVDPNLFGIKNPDAQKTMKDVLAVLQSAAPLIESLL